MGEEDIQMKPTIYNHQKAVHVIFHLLQFLIQKHQNQFNILKFFRIYGYNSLNKCSSIVISQNSINNFTWGRHLRMEIHLFTCGFTTIAKISLEELIQQKLSNYIIIAEKMLGLENQKINYYIECCPSTVKFLNL